MTDSLRTCSLVTGSLQPYALDFYRALDRALNAHEWRLRVIVGTKTTYRPWSGMGLAEDDPLFTFISGTPAPDWVQKVLGSPARDKIMLPGGGRLNQTLEDYGTEILILNERNPLSMGAALWARRHRIPTALSTDIGRNPPPYAATKSHLVYHRLIARLFDGAIGKTRDGSTAYVKASALPPILAPHGIDTARYPAVPPPAADPFRFLFVGVLELRKGLDSLMAAGRQLYEQGRRFEIRVVGSGSWAPDPADVSAPWLSMAGFKEGAGLLAEYQAAHAYVLPTRQDTYGVTVHEAASCGLPLLVGSAAGASQVLVEDGKSGFHLDPSDPAAIAAKMARLLDEPGLAAALGKRARELAEEWCTVRSGERVAEWLLDLHAREKKLAPA